MPACLPRTKWDQHAWIVLSLFLASSTCAAGQDKSSVRTAGQSKLVAKGQIVAELDKAIWHVFQARNNDYWFGSHDRGVYCYNGKTLVNFTTKDGLADNSLGLGPIKEDKSGNLYFNTARGISRFDGISFVTLGVTKSSSATGEWKLQPDDLWFQGTQDAGALYRYDGKSLHRLEFPKTKDGDEHYRQTPRGKFPKATYSPYDVYSIFKDRLGNVWFGTALLGACRFDGKSFAWLPERELRNGSFGTRSIIEDKEGRFWFCNTLHRYSVDLNDSTRPKFRKLAGLRTANDPTKAAASGIMSSTVDNHGTLWMATYGRGVWRYDGKGMTQYPVRKDGNRITLFSISKDNRGVLWLGTQDSGVYRFNGKEFVEFTPR